MIDCNCSTGMSSRKVKHEWNCGFLRNLLYNYCCDKAMETAHLQWEHKLHNAWCKYEVEKPEPKRSMWVRLLVYEGTDEWIEMCKKKSLKEGVTPYGGHDSITATTVCRWGKL